MKMSIFSRKKRQKVNAPNPDQWQQMRDQALSQVRNYMNEKKYVPILVIGFKQSAPELIGVIKPLDHTDDQVISLMKSVIKEFTERQIVEKQKQKK
jgi:hypothetical protein